MDSERIFTRTPSPTDRTPERRRFRVTPPMTWLAGAILLIAALGAAVQCFTGTITRSVAITGVVFPHYGIIRGVSDRVANNEELIRKITEELRVFKKGE